MTEGFEDIFTEFEKGEKPKPKEPSKQGVLEIPVEPQKDPPEPAEPVKSGSLLDALTPADSAVTPAPSLPVEEPVPVPVSLVPEPAPVISTEKWDFAEDKTSGKEVWLFFGLKGHGKTKMALSFTETVEALSFDQKTAPIKANVYGGDPRITVHNAVKYMDYSSPQAQLESSDRTFRFIMALLDHIAAGERPDWILIDACDIYIVIAEMVMRYRNGLQPYQGIANLNLWKERRLYIRQIHHKSIEVAKKGIIYTAFTKQHEIIQDGDFITKEDIPRWIDAVMYETDYVIKTYTVQDEKGKRFMIHVDSSKNDQRIKTGETIDVTGRGIPLQTV